MKTSRPNHFPDNSKVNTGLYEYPLNEIKIMVPNEHSRTLPQLGYNCSTESITISKLDLADLQLKRQIYTTKNDIYKSKRMNVFVLSRWYKKSGKIGRAHV